MSKIIKTMKENMDHDSLAPFFYAVLRNPKDAGVNR